MSEEKDLVLYGQSGSAAVLRMNRPDKRNSFSRGLVAGLTEGMRRARDDAAARCVILTGEGPAFCAGMDLAELREALDRPTTRETLEEDAHRLLELFEMMTRMAKPIIAAVNGPAVAGGAGLMTACDLVVARAGAKIGYPEVKRGLVAALVMTFLVRQVGERTAKYLLLTGELITAEEAQRLGLVNEVVPADRLMPRALELADILAQSGPESLGTTKEFLNELLGAADSSRLNRAAELSATIRLTGECREGLAAFFEGRRPSWQPKV